MSRIMRCGDGFGSAEFLRSNSLDCVEFRKRKRSVFRSQQVLGNAFARLVSSDDAVCEKARFCPIIVRT